MAEKSEIYVQFNEVFIFYFLKEEEGGVASLFPIHFFVGSIIFICFTYELFDLRRNYLI